MAAWYGINSAADIYGLSVVDVFTSKEIWLTPNVEIQELREATRLAVAIAVELRITRVVFIEY